LLLSVVSEFLSNALHLQGVHSCPAWDNYLIEIFLYKFTTKSLN